MNNTYFTRKREYNLMFNCKYCNTIMSYGFCGICECVSCNNRFCCFCEHKKKQFHLIKKDAFGVEKLLCCDACCALGHCKLK